MKRASREEVKFRNELILQDIKDGIPPSIIVRKYNITENCLRQIYSKYGYKCYFVPHIDMEEIKMNCVNDWLQSNGELSYQQIADKNGCSFATAYKAIADRRKETGEFQHEQEVKEIQRKHRFLKIQTKLAEGKSFRQIAQELKESNHQKLHQFYQRELKRYENK